MRTKFICTSILRVASGTTVKLASCKSALNPSVVYSTDRFKTVVPLLVLFCVALWFSTRQYVLSLAWCYFVIAIFSHLSIAITSLGEEWAKHIAFRTFVRFALVWFCLFPIPLGFWEGLRLLIIALPEIFCYFFLSNKSRAELVPTLRNCRWHPACNLFPVGVHQIAARLFKDPISDECHQILENFSREHSLAYL